MKKYIYDKSNDLWYELHGNYYIPCLVLPDTEERSFGIWGRKHLDYVKEYCPVYCTQIWFSVASCTVIWLTLIPKRKRNSLCF